MSNNAKVIGRILTEQRKLLGITADEMAKITSIGTTTYDRIEAGGNCRRDTFDIIVTKGLEMRISTFYKLVENDTKKNKKQDIEADKALGEMIHHLVDATANYNEMYKNIKMLLNKSTIDSSALKKAKKYMQETPIKPVTFLK